MTLLFDPHVLLRVASPCVPPPVNMFHCPAAPLHALADPALAMPTPAQPFVKKVAQHTVVWNVIEAMTRNQLLKDCMNCTTSS